MRKSWWLVCWTLALASLAVPCTAAEPAPTPAVHATNACTPALPQTTPAPLFASRFLCGSCAGNCAGLFTGSACDDHGIAGVCLAVLAPSGSPVRCPGMSPGNQCGCVGLDS
jgi:hypothetical protein